MGPLSFSTIKMMLPTSLKLTKSSSNRRINSTSRSARILQLLPSKAWATAALVATLALLPGVSACSSWGVRGKHGPRGCCCACLGIDPCICYTRKCYAKPCPGHCETKDKNGKIKYDWSHTKHKNEKCIKCRSTWIDVCPCLDPAGAPGAAGATTAAATTQVFEDGQWKCSNPQCRNRPQSFERAYPYKDGKTSIGIICGERPGAKTKCVQEMYYHSKICVGRGCKIFRKKGVAINSTCDNKCRCDCPGCHDRSRNAKFKYSRDYRRLADAFPDCSVCEGSGKTRSWFHRQPCENCIGIGKVRD